SITATIAQTNESDTNEESLAAVTVAATEGRPSRGCAMAHPRMSLISIALYKIRRWMGIT
ncbi:MAG: hypothetical protein K2G75_05845, partial [Muribaculaceae bacterium]|nr:hypothetical protein [Muribaculaceae bacterium]